MRIGVSMIARGRGRRAGLGVLSAAMGAVVAMAVLLLFSTAALAAAPEEPLTKAATGVTATEAILHGELNPNVSGTAGYEFTYNTNGTCEGTTTELQAEITGKGLPVEQALTNLEPSKEYKFCAVATHLEGETLEAKPGAPLSFKTLAAPPAVESESASAVTPFEAHLESVVNPNNQITSCEFEYGLTTGYGTAVPCEPASLEGFGGQGAGLTINGLTPSKIYHFRVVVENASHEKTDGPDTELTTLTLEAPIVDSESISALQSTSVTLEAQVNPNYQETHYSFSTRPMKHLQARRPSWAKNPSSRALAISWQASRSRDSCHARPTTTECSPKTAQDPQRPRSQCSRSSPPRLRW